MTVAGTPRPRTGGKIDRDDPTSTAETAMRRQRRGAGEGMSPPIVAPRTGTVYHCSPRIRRRIRSMPERVVRPRRSCLSVPGSSPKMLAKGPTLPADEVFMDLEDSVAPLAKEDARGNIIDALKNNDWTGKTVVVRINSIDTQWAADDLKTVVENAGAYLDCVMIPKVQYAHEVMFVDHMLRMIETNFGLEKRIGIEAQIETATGLENINEIAHASDRIETLIFGPADMSASLGLPTVTAGLPMPGYPGDHWHWVLEKILVAARDAGLQAIDGPYLLIKDLDGFREMAMRARALGYDGKWAVHLAERGRAAGLQRDKTLEDFRSEWEIK